MFVTDLKIGEAVQIGEAAVVRVKDKSGRRVTLVIASTVGPIQRIPTGIIPERFTLGLTGTRQPARLAAVG